MARALAEGYSVSVNGLGRFKASVDIREEMEMDTIDGVEPLKSMLDSACV